MPRQRRRLRRFSSRFRLLARVSGGSILLALVGGAAGFALTEGHTFADGLFQALVVITTVGYSPLPPPGSIGGKLVMAATLLVGIGGLFGGALALITEAVELIQSHRWTRAVKATDHFIVCGFSRIGQVVARELQDAGEQVVVVDQSEDGIEDARSDGFDAVLGDAADDETLRKADVESARGLVTTFRNDAENVFVIVSAKTLNPDLVALTTAASTDAAGKLEQVGADRVVTTDVTAGRMLARAAKAPLAVDLVLGSILTGNFEECTVESGSPLEGKRLRELSEDEPRVLVMAYLCDGHMEANPDPDTRIEAGMSLLVVGREERMAKLRRQASAS